MTTQIESPASANQTLKGADERRWPTDEQFDDRMREQGWTLFPGVLDQEQVNGLCDDCDVVYRACRPIQIRNGVAENMEGAAHHVVGHGGALDEFLEQFPLYDNVERHFGGKFILLNYGIALNPPRVHTYTFKPHRDVRAFTPGYHLSLNMLVMLSDFTPENGATLVAAGSHRVEALPSPEAFQQTAQQITGDAGDIVLFDSLLVHAAASNLTLEPRRALTLCLGRPFMKPQMDWPRYTSPEFQARMNPTVRQLLGFNARVATSLEEYYQPEERWTFRADQR